MPKRSILDKAFILCVVLLTSWLYLLPGGTLSNIYKLNYQPICKHTTQNSTYNISTDDVSWDIIENTVRNVQPGGRYTPNDCISTWRVAIIVPYKDGEKNLKVFLRNIHPFLQEQNLDYGIFVIEMPSSKIFNRGLLMNAGFKESSRLDNYNCFIFHDVDLLPENRRNIYQCSDRPKHMSSAINTRNYKMSNDFGGVKAFSKDQFTLVNGFSNVYAGSGRDDSHLYYRAQNANLTIKRLALDIGRYRELGHQQPTLAQENVSFYKLRQQRRLSDGLSSLAYRKMKLELRPLYTLIVIGINNRTSLENDGKVLYDAQDFQGPADGFYTYVSTRGISIENISENKYRISHSKWNCNIDTSIAKKFVKENISWKDMFETRIQVLSNKTVFSADTLRKKLGILPEDGTPVTLVARQGDFSIPKENIIIRLNNHGPLDARTTMIMTWQVHVPSLTMCARNQSQDEIIHWIHYTRAGIRKYYGLWNTSHPLVIPESVWNVENLKYYRGPLFFMKGGFFYGNLAKCNPGDGIGLVALNRVAQLKGEVSTLGFTTGIDSYNTAAQYRFYLLAHKLVWSYFVIEELTDTA